MIGFEIRGRRLPVYTVMLYVGLLVALGVGDQLARRHGLSSTRVLIAMVLTVPFLLAGARGLAVLLGWAHFRTRMSEIGPTRRGGAAMYGALPPAMLVTVPLLSWFGLPYGTFWDIGAVAILAGMIPTRFGCLSSGCCSGRPTNTWLGLRLPNARGVWRRRFPTQMYEASLGAVLLIALGLSWARLPFPGAAFLLALGGYSAGRFLLDALREEPQPRLAGLGALQWVSLGFLAVSAIGLTAGWMAGTPRVESLAASAGGAGIARVVASGLALLPVMFLFRFLGCSFFLSEGDPAEPSQLLQLAVGVPPDTPPEEYTVTIGLIENETGDEIEGSPFDLAPRPPLADGTLIFETLEEIPEAAYTANCLVANPSLTTRIGSCSGELDAPSLSVTFFVVPTTLPNAIGAAFCFETPPAP